MAASVWSRCPSSSATAREPAIVFPDYIFTQIPEARHLAGTIAIDGDLMVQLLDNVCREIARNGLKKIALVNAHGGNRGVVSLFNMLQLNSPRDYVVYLVDPFGGVSSRKNETPWDPSVDGHAGPGETSMILASRPDLVKMDQVPADDEWQARERLRSLREAGVQPGVWWYADHPTHYAGDATFSDAAAGERLLDAMAEGVARGVRAIKTDAEAKRLQDQFFRESNAMSSVRRRLVSACRRC